MSQAGESHETDDLMYSHLTPEGEGGIGIFHLYGPGLQSVLFDLFQPASGTVSWKKSNLYYGWLKDGEERIDEVVVRVVPAEHPLTGCQTAELNTHSGPAILKRVRRLLQENGATLRKQQRYLEQMETKGNLDQFQREAYESLQFADTRRAAVALSFQLQGELSECLRGLRNTLLADDVQTQKVVEELSELIRRGRSGTVLTEPREMCILGPPNAGKSTLMNTLSQKERSIVHEEAGTTRDVVQDTIYVQGYPIRVRDTAGLHPSGNEIEREGIRRGKQMAESADLILWITETLEDAISTPDVLSGGSIVRVKNKEDLEPEPEYGITLHDGQEVLRISAEQEQGIDQLRQQILKSLEIEHDLSERSPMPFRSEHIELLRSVRDQIQSGCEKEAAELISDVLEN